MGKKVVGLVLSVALLMVVLSGCFLLPKPDTVPPIVTITSPANGGNFEVLPNGSKDVTVEASVTAHSPIQSVTFAFISANFSQTVSANGPIGQTSGTFTYTFAGLTPGKYSLSVEAYSSARFPGRASSVFGITATTVYENPVVGDITLTPNYQQVHYVTDEPIQFSAQVTNPNNTGSLNVAATVNEETAGFVSSSNGVYTFTYTPTAAGTYTFAVNAVLTVDSKTYTGSNSKTENVYVKPAVSNLQSPEDYSVATANPSFTFTTTDGVTAYLSVNGSTHAPYTSGSAITNLVPNQWNTLTLTFQDPWNNPMSTTSTVHVLGVQSSNSADTPYVFLIDKNGHVVNTNDWIHKNAGTKIDLYGYILQGSSSINSYDIVESYYTNENLTTMTYTGSVAASTTLNTDKVPLRLVAYLFNEQASDTFIKFNINVNNSAAAFLRYDVAPVAANSVNVNVSPVGGTYEAVPATLNVTVNSVQPLTSIILGQPFKVGEPFDGYATTTAYSNSQNKTNVMTFDHHYIMPVSAVEASDIAAYGVFSRTFPLDVAFYGPSGTYQIGATVTAVANQIATATTNYVVQADTAAPTIKIENNTTNAATIGTVKAYYGPMGVKATVTDDHAIYWAKFDSQNVHFENPNIVFKDNNASITNYGATEVTTTATVTFGQTGPFTIWAVASDKHFDPTNYATGNTANSIKSISGIYDHTPPTASLVGGKYDINVASETYAFTIAATDGNGVGLADTANVEFVPISGGTSVPATATIQPDGKNYKVVVDTSILANKRYSVALSVKDKLYDMIPSSATELRAEHITTIETGYISVNHTYPKVALYNLDGSTEKVLGGSTPTVLTSDVFRIKINDPDFQWSWVDANNYKSYLKISLYGPNYGFEPMTKLVRIVHQTDSATGFFDVEIPEVYFNAGEGTNTVATSTIQVDVYDSVQDDKALFGRATGKFIPISLFASEGEPGEPVVNFNSKSVSLNGENSTPVVVPSDPSDFEVTFTLEGMANKEGMSLTFYANNTKIAEVPASNTTVTLRVPINPDWQPIKFWVRYAPSSTRTFNSVSVSDVNAYGYHYDYTIGTAWVLGDTIPPAATITANGITVNSSTVITDSASLEYAVNGVAFYEHDGLVNYYADLLQNTTVNGTVTFANAGGSSVFATATLGATDLLSATTADFVQGTEYTIFNKKLSEATAAGIYNINFMASDPFRSWSDTKTATVVVDLDAPTLSTVELNGSVASDTTSGMVTAIANGDTLSVKATDDTGVKAATMTVKNLIYPTAFNTNTMMIANSGIGAFSKNASAVVALPTYVGAEFQNLPYEVVFSAEDVAGRSAAEVTRLFVTNVDLNPEVSRFVLQAPNKLLVRLPEPMWVEGFKLFTAYSTTFGGTITSNDIAPVTVLASYKGNDIANEFVVTFSSDVWSDPTGTNEWGDLSNVHMLDANNASIKDLAGNIFVVPVSHTIIPPTLNVTPEATYYVGANQPVTYDIAATSSAGIKQTVGYFAGQTKVLNTPTGQLTFTSPNLQDSTATYNATFVTTDKSLDANQASATRVIFVNAKKPTVTIHASSIIAVDATLTVTGQATVGDVAGTNVIYSIVVENTTNNVTVDATFNSASTTTWTATFTGLQLETATNTIQVTVTDKYENVSSTSTTVYVDDSVPTITVTFEASHTNNGNITNGSSNTIYVATPATFSWNVTTDSGTDATVTGEIATTTSPYTSYSTSDDYPISTSTQYTISIVATNPVSKKAATFIATRTVVIDNTTPNATLSLPSTLNLDNFDTAVATYTATDMNFDSAMLTINGYDMNVGQASPATEALNDSAFGLGTINGATVTATLTVADKAGNVTSISTEMYVDTVSPTISSVAASETSGATVIYIYFSEPVATTSSFSPHDIVFTYNTTTYVASDITFTPNATFIGVENFTTGLSAADLPAADWTVKVGNNVTDIARNPVSGTGEYDNQ